MYLDVDGELVAFGLSRRLALAERLLALDVDSKVAVRLLDNPTASVVAVYADDFDEIRDALSRLHAEQGVLLDDLGHLQEAVGAARARHSLVARLQ